MPKTLRISPITRIEGHLDVEITVDTVDGTPQVVDAKAGGMMFRGFEIILAGRDPRDAVHYTQRICGVCPVSHAMASSLTLEDAFSLVAPANGRILRNLILGANFIQSHLLHFYHLASPDYLNTEGLLNLSPWKPRYSAPDMLTGTDAELLVSHYLKALEMRRKAHEMGALFGGKLPMPASFVAGGCTETAGGRSRTSFRTLLTEIREFIDTTYLPDLELLGTRFPDYFHLGRGPGNLLAYGVFDLDGEGSTKLLGRGRDVGGADATLDTSQIKEYVSHSWYSSASGNVNPSQGVTEPTPNAGGDAYSWVKAPRYADTVHEVGALARMWVNGDYRNGISALDRLTARARETKKIADAMDGWLDELELGGPVYEHAATPATAMGMGLTEAPRGALGHWISIEDAKIARYQVITPTAWNASPRDDLGQLGAMEQGLIGTPVRDMSNPVEVLRVVHSFDPCLACSVHMLRPGDTAARCTVPGGALRVTKRL